MSGNFSVIPVLNGQLSTVQSTLFVSPLGISTYFKTFSLISESSAIEHVQVWMQPSGGNIVLWRQFTLRPGEACDVLEDGESLTLAAGDALLAATSYGPVDYTLAGVQEA
jgi:hypothetical protein